MNNWKEVAAAHTRRLININFNVHEFGKYTWWVVVKTFILHYAIYIIFIASLRSTASCGPFVCVRGNECEYRISHLPKWNESFAKWPSMAIQYTCPTGAQRSDAIATEQLLDRWQAIADWSECIERSTNRQFFFRKQCNANKSFFICIWYFVVAVQLFRSVWFIYIAITSESVSNKERQKQWTVAITLCNTKSTLHFTAIRI